MITANELIKSSPIPLEYKYALRDFTCGSCHILAYEMLKLLSDDNRYRIACLEEHAFIIDVFFDVCYDITGELPTCDIMEKWGCDWEESVCEYTIDELDEYVEIANEMYIEDIEPNSNNWTMRNARYWAEKMVEAIKCGATNELNEQVQEHNYSGKKINFDKILKKHLTNYECMVS